MILQNTTVSRANLSHLWPASGAQSCVSTISSAQQRIWFLEQLCPDTALYTMPVLARVSGNLDAQALEKAANIIVSRHEPLRYRFDNHDGEPVLLLDEESKPFFETVDLSGIPEGARKLLLEKKLASGQKPFDLQKGPLLRVQLLKTAPQEHLLFLNMHHIISDEWSLRLFFQELEALYLEFAWGIPAALPELPIRYSDYAVAQHNWVKGSGYQEQLHFWRNHLGENPSGVRLPMFRETTRSFSVEGAVKSRRVGRETLNGLNQMVRSQRATSFMILMAAFKALLFRYSGQEDLIVGTPIAGRTQIETENLVGLFVNTLPLRTRITSDMTFQQLLRQVREVALAAYSNQDLPFEKMVEALQPERSSNGSPLINVLFINQKEPPAIRWPGMDVQFLDLTTSTAKFALTLVVQELPDDLLVEAEYKTACLDENAATQMLERYERLLRGAIAAPESAIARLPF